MYSETMPSKPVLPTFQFLVLPPLFLALVIVLRPSMIFRMIALALLSLVSYYGTVAYSTGDLFIDYIQGTTFGVAVANAMHFLLLSDPMMDFRHDNDKASPMEKGFLGRMYWSLGLQNAMRGVGWNYKLPHTPDSPTDQRWPFVAGQLKSSLWNLLLVDAAQSYIHWNPIFSGIGGNPPMPINTQGPIETSANVIAWCGTACWTFRLSHGLFALFSVAVGFYQPKDFPPLFGQWRDSYTLRRFWGRTWHQSLRRPLSSIGKSISRAVGAQPGTTISSYLQLYTAFIISGLVHSAGDAMVGTEHFGSSFMFFLVQAIAITGEDCVVGAARKAGRTTSSPASRAAGYVWVWCWFTYSVPLMVSWQVVAGLGKSEILPISPIRYVVQTVQALSKA